MKKANWIISAKDLGETCPVFLKRFDVHGRLLSARLEITSMGVYEAVLNGKRVGDFILAPGFTSYKSRLQYQSYDITDLLCESNELKVTVGNGWYCGRLAWMNQRAFWGKDRALIAKLTLCYADGTVQMLRTDDSWMCAASGILMSEIYDGETFDANVQPVFDTPAKVAPFSTDMLIPQEGETVREQERLVPVKSFRAPNGDWVVDFGQNLTGYVELRTDAKAGERIIIEHGEILDQDGNFFRENLRTAKARVEYICRDGVQVYKPRHCFMGFRYIRVLQAPESTTFTAVVVHSDIRRTGSFECGHAKVNQLFHNIIWGQKGNFLDIPTDCPQRDERLGWTGDAQVFIRTASYNFDVQKFFRKWLNDLKADQMANGSIPHVIPNLLEDNDGSAAWGDASVICPWQLYLSYGDRDVLERQYESMLRWVEFSKNPDRFHFGDWLALDEPEPGVDISQKTEFEIFQGNSNPQLISDAFCLYCLELLQKIAAILGRDPEPFRQEYEQRRADFVGKYTLRTQTEHTLALQFHLTDHVAETAARLNELVVNNGTRLQTGFVGTPYLLHALSDNGYTETAYGLLLQEAYPSWLFSVNQGATTVWEHWDGVRADGSLNDTGMNSYNHYAYGAVADWMYGVAAGIRTDENAPGFENVILAPRPDARLGYVKAQIETRYGTLRSEWKYDGEDVVFEFCVPNRGVILLADRRFAVHSGVYRFRLSKDGRVEQI